MELSKHLRVMLTAMACLALVAVVFAGLQAAEGPGTVEAPVTERAGETPCTGACATCPHADSTECDASGHVGDVREDDEQNEASVDAERCIGCARCVNIAPEAFAMDSETKKAKVVEGASPEAVHRGAQACPVDAIDE